MSEVLRIFDKTVPTAPPPQARRSSGTPIAIMIATGLSLIIAAPYGSDPTTSWIPAVVAVAGLVLIAIAAAWNSSRQVAVMAATGLVLVAAAAVEVGDQPTVAEVLGAVVLWVLLGLIPALIARSKGHELGTWWLYGFLLLIVALPHSLVMEPDAGGIQRRKLAEGMKKCPFCAEIIRGEAKVCRYCGRDVPTGTSAR